MDTEGWVYYTDLANNRIDYNNYMSVDCLVDESEEWFTGISEADRATAEKYMYL